MKIAVLMSSYNGEPFIETQIESVLAQKTDAEVHLIVRDDGSTDSTQEILQRYADEGKLQWYTGENLKPAKSFLDLVSHCRGYDYYAFCDQDDYWHPDKLQTGISALAASQQPALSFANARLVDCELQYLGRNVYNHTPPCDFYSALCCGGYLGCTMVFNEALAALLRTYSRPETLIMHDSYAAIVCTLFEGTITYVPTAHMDYRQHSNNVVGTNLSKWDTVKDRLRRITRRSEVTIAAMAQSILAQDVQGAAPDHMAFLKRVAAYRKNPFSAISLACSRKPSYGTKNMAITKRLAILLRNR